MKTIKERVQGFCKRCRTTQPYCPCTPKEQQNCMIYDAYVKGATEQKQIDDQQLRKMENALIDKACEWLRENIDKYLYNRGGDEEYIPTCGDILFNDFRKAIGGNDGQD